MVRFKSSVEGSAQEPSGYPVWRGTVAQLLLGYDHTSFGANRQQRVHAFFQRFADSIRIPVVKAIDNCLRSQWFECAERALCPEFQCAPPARSNRGLALSTSTPR
jgi:hypothetical protein